MSGFVSALTFPFKEVITVYEEAGDEEAEESGGRKYHPKSSPTSQLLQVWSPTKLTFYLLLMLCKPALIKGREDTFLHSYQPVTPPPGRATFFGYSSLNDFPKI